MEKEQNVGDDFDDRIADQLPPSPHSSIDDGDYDRQERQELLSPSGNVQPEVRQQLIGAPPSSTPLDKVEIPAKIEDDTTLPGQTPIKYYPDLDSVAPKGEYSIQFYEEQRREELLRAIELEKLKRLERLEESKQRFVKKTLDRSADFYNIGPSAEYARDRAQSEPRGIINPSYPLRYRPIDREQTESRDYENINKGRYSEQSTRKLEKLNQYIWT